MFKIRKSHNPAGLEERLAQKEQELRQLQDEATALEADLQKLANSDVPVDADAITKKHIKELKEYNTLKDTALSLMTMIADQRQVRLSVVMKEVGVKADDE